MALPELKQAQALIERASQVLLIVPERSGADAQASMIALYIALQSIKPNHVDEVSSSHVLRELQFLPGSSQVLMKPKAETEVVLDIAGMINVTTVRHEKLQGGVRLHAVLKPGDSVTKDQIEVSVRGMPYDVVIVFGSSDLEDLGNIFVEHTGFFYSTPIINIDHRANNEHFGTVNLVDITAGSVAEVTYDLIKAMQGDSLEADIATALYAGVVAGTDSFQRPSTTPRSFQVAARLMELDADREAVIQHLIKTKPLPLLKLTGRLYARLRMDEHAKLFWSLLRPVDFQESGAIDDDLETALYELANNIAGFNATFVLHEKGKQQFELHLLLGKGLLQRRHEIQERLSASRRNGILAIPITAPSLEEAESQALEQVRAILP